MPNILYSRDPSRKKYISITKHQRNARNQFSKWISFNIEKDVFDYADYGNFQKLEIRQDGTGYVSWTCTTENMWGLLPDYSEIGTEHQQFGFFQCPVNPNDEWHGFPIIPFSNSRYYISDELLSRWAEESIISVDDIPMIKSKKRI